MERSDNAKKFAIASGIVAILAAALNVVGLVQSIIRLRGWDFNLSLSFYFYNTIGSIVMVLSMVLIAVYVFAFYGRKKSPLFAISSLLITAIQIYTCIRLVITILSPGVWSYTYIRSYYSFQLIIGVLSVVVFVMMTIKFFSMKPSASIKAFPIIAAALTVISSIVPRFFLNAIQTNINILGIVSSWLHIVPFLLFALFCLKGNVELSHSTEEC